jgi:hypothetical protein
MLDFRDFVICLVAVILAMAAFATGAWPVGIGIVVVGGLLAAAPK